MDKSKIVFGIVGGIAFGPLYQQAVHVSPLEQVTAPLPTVYGPPMYDPTHGNDPERPGGPLRAPWPIAAVTTSTAPVSAAVQPPIILSNNWPRSAGE
jgi:hypothetical protein